MIICVDSNMLYRVEHEHIPSSAIMADAIRISTFDNFFQPNPGLLYR